MSLSSLIVQREVATIRQVEEALARQVLYGGDLVTNLLEVAQLPEAELVPLLAESLGVTAAPIGELPAPSDQARSLVPGELAARRALVPMSVEAGKLVIAVAEPLDAEVHEELAFALGMPVEERVAPMVRIRQALAAAYGSPVDRRMNRLLQRLAGVETAEPSSLPPLVRSAVARNKSTPPPVPVRFSSKPAPADGDVTVRALGSPRVPRATKSDFPPLPEVAPLVPTPTVPVGAVDDSPSPARTTAKDMPAFRPTSPSLPAPPPSPTAPPSAPAGNAALERARARARELARQRARERIPTSPPAAPPGAH